MAEQITLICNGCSTEEETEEGVIGWIKIGPSRKSVVKTDPPARGDFCSSACLAAYVGRMVVQGKLEGLTADMAPVDGDT